MPKAISSRAQHFRGQQSPRRQRARYAASGFLPSDIANLAEWLRADSIVGYTDGQEITTDWPARAGVDAAPAGTSKPTYVASYANGHPGVQMTNAGAGTRFQIASPPASLASQPNTHFMVATMTAGGGTIGRHMMDASAGRNLIGFPSGANLGYYAGTVVDSSTVAGGTPFIVVAVFNGASSALYKNGGAAIATGNPGTSGVSGTWYVVNATDALDAKYGEEISYHAALAAADINRVGEYLGTRYGITWTAVS